MTAVDLLAQGALLGLAAGVSPGPLLALVVGQTLRHGVAEGVKASLAPLVTDVPIILAATAALSWIADTRGVLGAVTLAGAVFVAYLGWETLVSPAASGTESEAPRSVLRGAAVNALSPHPYLFWAAVGGPIVVRTWPGNRPGTVCFLAGFYVFLVGSKVGIAVLVGQTRRFVAGRLYRGAMRAIGALLLAFSVRLLVEGVSLLRGVARY